MLLVVIIILPINKVYSQITLTDKSTSLYLAKKNEKDETFDIISKLAHQNKN